MKYLKLFEGRETHPVDSFETIKIELKLDMTNREIEEFLRGMGGICIRYDIDLYSYFNKLISLKNAAIYHYKLYLAQKKYKSSNFKIFIDDPKYYHPILKNKGFIEDVIINAPELLEHLMKYYKDWGFEIPEDIKQKYEHIFKNDLF